MATHSGDLAWRIPRTEDLAGCSPWGHKESDTTEHASTHLKGVVHFCWHLPDRDLRTCPPVIHVSRRKSRP